MPRQDSITITTPNGAKVRTVNSKQYFVLHQRMTSWKYNPKTHEQEPIEPTPVATVSKRTDSPMAALAEVRRNPTGAFIWRSFVNSDGAQDGREMTQQQLEQLAGAEKRRKKSEAAPPRSIWSAW
jgi:hypothetical protein